MILFAQVINKHIYKFRVLNRDLLVQNIRYLDKLTVQRYRFFQRNFKSHQDGGRMVQKLWIEALFFGTLLMKFLSYLRLKFNIDFIRWGLPTAFLYAQRIFSQVWKTAIMLWNLETTLNVSETKEERFSRK